MATLGLIEYKDASPEVRAVYDDIMATRKTDWINNFWKAMAHDPATLKRTWEDIKQIMAPGALDPLTKEMIYLAVSVSNQCGYCIASHTAGARNKGMTDAMFQELMAVVGMANETNRLVAGYQVEIDEQVQGLGGSHGARIHHFLPAGLALPFPLLQEVGRAGHGAGHRRATVRRSRRRDNSIAIIVKHLVGNMRSRWTDFLSQRRRKAGPQTRHRV